MSHSLTSPSVNSVGTACARVGACNGAAAAASGAPRTPAGVAAPPTAATVPKNRRRLILLLELLECSTALGPLVSDLPSAGRRISTPPAGRANVTPNARRLAPGYTGAARPR